MKTALPHSYRSEQGVFLPIAAILATVIATAIFTFGIDTYLTKLTQRQLRSDVDLICRRVASQATIQKNAQNEFDIAIGELAAREDLPSPTTVSEARLLIPTMPADGSFLSINNTGPFDVGEYGREDLIPSQQRQYWPRCSAADVRCAFITDPHAPALGQNIRGTRFPTAANDTLRSVGNSVGCEVEFKIKPLLNVFGDALDRTIRIKSMWWLPVRGRVAPKENLSCNRSADPLLNIPDSPTGKRPGLLVGIASELFNFSENPISFQKNSRLRFTSQFLREGIPETFKETALFTPDSFQDLFDPLRRFATPRNTRKFINNRETPYNSEFKIPVAFENTSSTTSVNRGFGSSRIPACDNPQSCVEAPDLQSYWPSEQEWLMLSCTNPVVMVRNLFTSTLIELASRHGQLRDSTEIVHINPRGPLPNPPTQITTFGQDIAQPAFQTPYLFFNYISSSGILWNDPFFPANSEVVESTSRYHALLASQLRHCFQLYDRTDNITETTGTITRADLQKYRKSLDNNGFEPVPPYFFRDKIVAENRTVNSWDQNQPWCVGASCPDRLTAAEVVSTLGSSSFCPTQSDSLPELTDERCAQIPHPDILSFMRYAQRLSPTPNPSSAEYNVNSCGFPAISSPGLFPLKDGSKSLPFEARNYFPTGNPAAHILLVLHHFAAVDEAELATIIREANTPPAAGSGLSFKPRPITVAYFPASPTDLSTELPSLKRALAAGQHVSTLESTTPSFVKLLVFQPERDPADITPVTSEELQEYWNTLLTNPENNIVRIAESLFYNRILRTELKY